MLEVEDTAELATMVGRTLGTGDWLTVDQDMIDAFARATGDDNWIHVDVERAAREMPGGRTIAHGFLTLSLLPKLSRTVYRVRRRGRALNYGTNRVRFTAPVPSGARIRLTQTLKGAEETAAGTRLTFDCVVEVEGSARPAMVAESMVLVAKDG